LKSNHDDAELARFMRKNYGNYKQPLCFLPRSLFQWKTFRDALSRKEYGISGLCQKCQDDVFGKEGVKVNIPEERI